MQFEKWMDIDLNKPRNFVPDLGFPVFTGDDYSVRVGVNVFKDKVATNVSGTVKGYVILPNGAMIQSFNGAKSGNQAWIDLPDDAFQLSGRIQIAIRLTDSTADPTQKTVLFCASATVRRVDSDTIIPPVNNFPTWDDVMDKIGDLDEAIESVPHSILYDSQELTSSQKATARGNIGAVSEDDLSDMKSAINPIINQNNVFGDPQCTDITTYSGTSSDNYRKWKTLSYTLAHGDGTDFSNAYYFDNDGTNKPYLIQDFFPTDITSGTYYLSLLVKAGFSETYASLAGSVTVIGYPTAANSGGTSLVTKNVTYSTLELAGDDYYRFGTTLVIPDASSYNHVRVSLYFNTTALDVWIAEPYLSKTDGHFSEVGNDLQTLGGDVATLSAGLQETQNDLQATDADLQQSKTMARAIVNPDNIFANPQMLTHDGWRYLTTDFTVEQSENQTFGIFKMVTGETQPYIYQVFAPTDLPAGEYHFSLRANVSEPTTLRLYTIAYPTSADSGGTTTQLASINLTTGWATYNETVTMPDVSTYDHIRVLIQCVGKQKTYNLSELYLAPAGVQNYASYILSELRKAQPTDIRTTSQLYGKTLYADGDSIAYGAGAGGVSYVDLLATKYNMTLDKQAVSGGTMAYVANKHCIANSVVSHYDGQDFVILDGGFNDLGSSVPIGALPTSVEQPLTPSPDTATFIGALQVAFQHIMNTNPTAKIWFLIPHRINKSYTKTTGTLGLTFQDYVDAIRLVCNRYGVEILDVYDNVNFNTYLDIYKPYTSNSDMVHPTLDGYQNFYMPYIEKITK